MKIQLDNLFYKFDQLQKKFGDKKLNAIYGAGCINKPDLFFIFMNPTGKNISSDKNWNGIKAPRLGTKNIWKLFNKIGLISNNLFDQIYNMKFGDWTENFSFDLYSNLSKQEIYITNLAKCTQTDARHLHDSVFKEYLDLLFQEIDQINPKKIICFGNQVSSILLGKNVKVSEYQDNKFEELKVKNKTYKVYPCFYPVGQGMRNMDKAITRLLELSS